MEAEGDARELFSVLDKDNSGFLTRQQMTEVIQQVNAETAQNEHMMEAFLNLLDPTNSGRVDFNSFYHSKRRASRQPRRGALTYSAFSRAACASGCACLRRLLLAAD
jgi:hypothetical protein